MDRPDVEAIHGIPPAIAIEQKNTVKNARSTVGTASEIYDYLRLLFAKIGEVFCPQCQIKVSGDTVENVVQQILDQYHGKKIYIISPVSLAKGETIDLKIKEPNKNGYYRIWEKGQILDLTSLSGSEIQERFSPSPSPLPPGDSVVISLRGSKTTEAISHHNGRKEIATLPSVARNDEKGDRKSTR